MPSGTSTTQEGLPPLHRSFCVDVLVDARCADRPHLVTKEWRWLRRLSTPSTRPKHSHRRATSIAHKCDPGLPTRKLPDLKNLAFAPLALSASGRSQFQSSEPSDADQAYFGPQTTRNPPTRHVPQWRSSVPSTSGVPQLHVPGDLPSGSSRLYRLEIVQHPLKAAEFGASTLTRLPLAPPLIAQLHYRDRTSPEDMDENDLPFLIAHLTLYNADGSVPVDIVGPGGQTPSQQRLYGNLVSSPHVLRNLQGRMGTYFLFPDVSIRFRGRYSLSVTLMKIPRNDPASITANAASDSPGVVLAQARSLPFDVFPRNEYVAPAQTPLTQYFLQQGVRMYAFASSLQFPQGHR